MAPRKQKGSKRGAGPAPGSRLLVETGFYEGLEWPLDQPRLVVGRGREADLILSEPTISRSHTAVVFAEGEWFAEDLNSTNGTVVNGTRTARVRLKDGDEIQLGRLILRARLKDGLEEAQRGGSSA